jgi:hypothetical protein
VGLVDYWRIKGWPVSAVPSVPMILSATEAGHSDLAIAAHVRFSNQRLGVKRFQTIHHDSVDVAHG